MSSTTDDDGSSSEDLSNLLVLADENLADERRETEGGSRDVPATDFADDRARVAALAAIADRAAALPPYAGDDAETDAVFDELLELHASLASNEPSSLEAMRQNDAFEARLDREALERAAGLVDAVAALAGDSGSETGVAARADATRRRLETSLEHLRAKQNECFEIVTKTTKMRRDALRHALDVADDGDDEEKKERDAMEEMETAFANAAADASASARFKVASSSLATLDSIGEPRISEPGDPRPRAVYRHESVQKRGPSRVSSDDDDDARAPSSRGASPEKEKTKSGRKEDVDDDVDDSSSSLDDVIDRELRNQRVTRARARARANAKVVEATAEARRAVEAEARAARSVGDSDDADSGANENENKLEKEDHPEDASLRAERDRRSKRKLRRRLVRDALVALPVLVFSLYDTARGERRRAAGAERAARRRAVLSADAASRSPAKTRAAIKDAGDAKMKTSRSPYAVPSSTTMKVGANSYEVENGRVVTLATPAEAREVRKAFGMG